ncbi:MAG: hypothetical protein LBS90_06755 [Oscillospiraceae bacterium]|jgi:YbbR domain-containing protein|nr:hypothetical protein [Oscillospiraceae bacterium]
MRERFDKIVRSRIFRIVIALAVSIALWIYVEFAVNEDVRQTLRDIPVEFVNAELVSDRQLIITDYGSPVVSAVFDGSRSVVTKLKPSSVRAVVDLSQLRETGSRAMQYELVYDEKIDVRGLTVSGFSGNGYVQLHIEKYVSKTIDFDYVYLRDIAAEDYAAGRVEFETPSVTVSGPESVVGGIISALVEIERENLKETVASVKYPFKLLDNFGSAVELTPLVTLSADGVYLTIPISMERQIPLEPVLIYGAGATPDNIEVTVTPKSVRLSGDTDLLGKLNSIKLGAIDLTSFDTEFDGVLPIIVPDALRNISGETEALVTVRFKKDADIAVRDFEVSTKKIILLNETPGYATDITTPSLTIRLRGPANRLALISEDDIELSVDLKSLGETASQVSLRVGVSVPAWETEIGAVGSYELAVKPLRSSG